MELTTYDDIWSCFRDISGLALDTIPNTDDDIRREIRNGIRSYNIKTDDSESKLTFDDMIETINQRLDDNRLKLLALIIKENFKSAVEKGRDEKGTEKTSLTIAKEEKKNKGIGM